MNTFPSIKSSSKKRQAGQAAVEFAFIIVFLVVLLMSFIEVTALVYTYSVLAGAAKEGVRYGIVHGTLSTTCNATPPGSSCAPGITAMRSVVVNYARGSLNNTAAGMTVNPTYPDVESSPSNRVRVEVSYTYQPLFGLGWRPLTLKAAAEGRITF